MVAGETLLFLTVCVHGTVGFFFFFFYYGVFIHFLFELGPPSGVVQ